ncbi:MAG TPA: HEAT repeat domain-containing protein [Lacipirellulaceae bacterium]|nr:HEAT repeat domain-containing protein [Lacipirellulaceae bacterium]
MADGLNKTLEVLATTRNRAVLPTLAAALQSSSAAVRAGAIRAVARRRDADSHRLLIGRFHELREDERAVAAEAHRAVPHHMARALKTAVLGSDARLCENACQMIAQSLDFESFPVLVAAAETPAHRAKADVTASLLHLAKSVDAELAAWSLGPVDGNSVHGDPSFTRRHLLAALDRSLNNYARHECRELIEAFLLLAPSDHALLRKILHDPQHACHGPVVAALATSTSPGTVARLVRSLCDTDAPLIVLQAIATRTDPEFIRALFSDLKPPVPLRVLHNMKRLTSVAWFEDDAALLLDLSGRAQAMAIELAVASSITGDALFRLLALMMKKGLTEARRASCRALARIVSPAATEVVVGALNDPDEGVRAAAVRQLRPRNVPGALQTLVPLLDSRSMEVRTAARTSLAEFNFARYRAMFDLLDETTAGTTGMLVHKVDAGSRAGLIEELASSSTTARLRGIEMAIAMSATQDVSEQLIELSRSENATVRREAVMALGRCVSAKAEHAIRVAMEDAHQSVRDAASDALAAMHRGRRRSSEAAAVSRGAL